MQRVDCISKGGNKNKTTKRDGNGETMTTTTTNRMIAVQMWGREQLCNIVWQGCDDPTCDRIRDCVRATQYCGRTIEHAT
jgi:hypothetical protein